MNLPKSGMVSIVAAVLMVPIILALLLPQELSKSIKWDNVPGPVDSWTVEWNENRDVYECIIRVDETGELLYFEMEIHQGLSPIYDPTANPVVPDSWSELRNVEG